MLGHYDITIWVGREVRRGGGMWFTEEGGNPAYSLCSWLLHPIEPGLFKTPAPINNLVVLCS